MQDMKVLTSQPNKDMCCRPSSKYKVKKLEKQTKTYKTYKKRKPSTKAKQKQQHSGDEPVDKRDVLAARCLLAVTRCSRVDAVD